GPELEAAVQRGPEALVVLHRWTDRGHGARRHLSAEVLQIATQLAKVHGVGSFQSFVLGLRLQRGQNAAVRAVDCRTVAVARRDGHVDSVKAPSDLSAVRYANRFGGCQAVTVDSLATPLTSVRTVPPSRGSISLRPMSQESI